MFTINISSLATMNVQIPVSATIGGTIYNPTSDAVAMAFIPSAAKPQSADWNVGSWDTAPGPTYMAQCLIGPNGGVTLATGVYTVWVKITDNPEQPIAAVGQLTIE